MLLEHHQADTDNRSDNRGKQDNRGQQLPPQPGAECGKQFEVAVPHALLAGDQLEQPVNRPQGEITCHRTPEGTVEIRKHAEIIQHEAQPHQGQRNAVW